MKEFQEQVDLLKEELQLIAQDLEDIADCIAEYQATQERLSQIDASYNNDQINQIRFDFISIQQKAVQASLQKFKNLQQKLFSRSKELGESQDLLLNMESYLDATKQIYSYLKDRPTYRALLREKVAIALEIKRKDESSQDSLESEAEAILSSGDLNLPLTLTPDIQTQNSEFLLNWDADSSTIDN